MTSLIASSVRTRLELGTLESVEGGQEYISQRYSD